MVPVYYSEPAGYTYCHELKLRLYGRLMLYPPREVPYSYYRRNKLSLELAPFRKGWLEKRFGREFPAIAFTYGEIIALPMETLQELARCMDVRPGRKGRAAYIRAVKRALRS
jgi:hypothetical protein